MRHPLNAIKEVCTQTYSNTLNHKDRNTYRGHGEKASGKGSFIRQCKPFAWCHVAMSLTIKVLFVCYGVEGKRKLKLVSAWLS